MQRFWTKHLVTNQKQLRVYRDTKEANNVSKLGHHKEIHLLYKKFMNQEISIIV
jgi:hypothetical protein